MTEQKTIHKIAAMVIKDNKFLMVRKVGKDIWTNLGGKPENGEPEEQALMREIKEELNCNSTIIRKIGDISAKAVFDDAIVKLSTYLVELDGTPKISDSELEEFAFIGADYKENGIKLPPSVEEQMIPLCLKEKLLNW